MTDKPAGSGDLDSTALNGTELDGTVSWGSLLRETETLLTRSGHSGDPKVEAKWMVEEATDTSGAEFADVLGQLATKRAVSHLDAMVQRRSTGEPIQYVLGHWAFRTLDLMVDQRVLIPRPETEIVAGLVLDELDRLRPNGGGTVVDLGTGSGAIGLSVVAERPISRVLLTDASEEALAVARANLTGLGLGARSVEITHGSWFEAVPERYLGECDVIVSNPPYVRTTDALPLSVIEWEPEGALLAGADGLDDLRIIVATASRWLRPQGTLVLEVGTGQTAVVAALAEATGYDVSVHHDFAGHDRAVVARRP
jgi:release factor glutamine methyltransferase